MNKIIWKKYSYHLMIKKEQKEQNDNKKTSQTKIYKNLVLRFSFEILKMDIQNYVPF